jgi:hypothetical protein
MLVRSVFDVSPRGGVSSRGGKEAAGGNQTISQSCNDRELINAYVLCYDYSISSKGANEVRFVVSNEVEVRSQS